MKRRRSPSDVVFSRHVRALRGDPALAAIFGGGTSKAPKARWKRERPLPAGPRTRFTFVEWPVRLVLPFAPATKKTDNRIIRLRGGGTKILPSDDWRGWIRQLRAAVEWSGGPLDVPTTGSRRRQPLDVWAVYYLTDRQRPDVSGLNESLGDALEELGVISNDYWIAAWPEPSPRRRDPSNPRVEVTIRPHCEEG